jgi:hypothetical protein
LPEIAGAKDPTRQFREILGFDGPQESDADFGGFGNLLKGQALFLSNRRKSLETVDMLLRGGRSADLWTLDFRGIAVEPGDR